MTGLYRAFDAATPPEHAPPGCPAVLGYIGGKRAARVWTLAEWQRFAGLRQFPAYVPDVRHEDPAAAAKTAAAEMRSLGWAPGQPARRVIICDLETEVVPQWYQTFAAAVQLAGFEAVAYGSLSTVGGNLAADVWVAAFDGSAALLPGQTVHAHQYAADVASGGTRVDYSVMDEWLFDRGGQGPRHA